MKNNSLLAVLFTTSILANTSLGYATEKSEPTFESGSELTKAITDGKVLFDARYRYEFVDQDGLAEEADAHTVRAKLGYETGKFKDFSALVEVENITDIGGEEYNDTINGKTTYPIVADPEDTALNRAQISYTGLPDTAVTLGRQAFNLDNQRFIGSIGWRQNDQTFDALSIKNNALKELALFYAYANQVNRIFGTDSPAGTWDNTDIHLLNASYSGLSFGKITGYAYLLDIPDSKPLSSSTIGARFEGKQALNDVYFALLNLEYAHQEDYAENPSSFSFNYYSVEPGISYGQWTLKGQYESIEGDGVNAMQFALGTNHAFDGWVDKFLTTPASGLVDANISVTYVAKSENPYINSAKVLVVYHDFSSERGSTNYGTEWNASIEQTFEKNYTAGIKFGVYEADALYIDTLKFMPYMQVKF